MCRDGRMGKRCHLLLQVAKLLCGELRGSLPNLLHPASPPQQFWQTGNILTASSLAPLLTCASPAVLADGKLHLHPAFLVSLLHSEEKLTVLFIVALHQALSLLCTSALSLLLLLATRNTRVSFALHCAAQPKPSPLWAGQDLPDLLLQFLTHEGQLAFASTGQCNSIVSPWYQCHRHVAPLQCRVLQKLKKPPW